VMVQQSISELLQTFDNVRWSNRASFFNTVGAGGMSCSRPYIFSWLSASSICCISQTKATDTFGQWAQDVRLLQGMRAFPFSHLQPLAIIPVLPRTPPICYLGLVTGDSAEKNSYSLLEKDLLNFCLTLRLLTPFYHFKL